jgi:hypothetical protein
VKPRYFPSAALFLQSAALLLLVSLMIAVGLPLAPSAWAQDASPSVDGTWVNIDASSRSLTMMEIHGNKLHPYGQCHPQPCDWGTIKAKPIAPNAAGGARLSLQAKTNQGFAAKSILVSLEADGRLRVEVAVHFTDDSGRGDYHVIEYFVRGRQPYSRY